MQFRVKTSDEGVHESLIETNTYEHFTCKEKRKKELNSLSFPNGLHALSNLPGNQIVEDNISRLVFPPPYKKEHIQAIRME